MCGYVIHEHKHTLLQAQPIEMATNDVIVTNEENTTLNEDNIKVNNIIVDYILK